jgi:hypothetical protein
MISYIKICVDFFYNYSYYNESFRSFRGDLRRDYPIRCGMMVGLPHCM